MHDSASVDNCIVLAYPTRNHLYETPVVATSAVRSGHALLVLGCLVPLAPAAERLPNLILIVADDLGYADVGVYGAKGFKTPSLDRLAREGVRFTDFHVAQAVCSASRAAIMTGC